MTAQSSCRPRPVVVIECQVLTISHQNSTPLACLPRGGLGAPCCCQLVLISVLLGFTTKSNAALMNIASAGKQAWCRLTPALVFAVALAALLAPETCRTASAATAWPLKVSSDGSTNYVAAAIADDGSLIAAYTPVAATLQVDLTRLAGPGTAQWFDPASGQAQGPAIPVENVGSRSFTTPGLNRDQADDWVLIITPRNVPIKQVSADLEALHAKALTP